MHNGTRLGAVVALTLVVGCQFQPLILRDSEQGRQWHWPYFLDGHPTVLVFWSTESMECLRAIPSLNTLSLMESSLQLISIATGPDRLVIDDWIKGRHEQPIRFTVLLDEEEKLAKKLDVAAYPTYVLFDGDGEELDRVYEIRLAYLWFRDGGLPGDGDTQP